MTRAHAIARPARVSVEFGFSPLSDNEGRSYFSAAHVEQVGGETVAYFTKSEADRIVEHYNAACDEWRPHSGDAHAAFVEDLGRSRYLRENGYVFMTVDGERYEWYATLSNYGEWEAGWFNVGRGAWSWTIEEEGGEEEAAPVQQAATPPTRTQGHMFPGGEDLPLMSGTAYTVTPPAPKPQPSTNRQLTMF